MRTSTNPAHGAPGSSPGAVRLPRAERRAQLIGAAASAFLERGYDGTSVESVAAQAGVTRLIVYRNFDGKEALYRAVLNSVTERLRVEFDDDRTTEIAARLLRVAREQPDAFRLLWRHARHEPAFAAEAEMFRLVAGEYADAIIVRYIADPRYRRWSAAVVVDHLHEGICTWLDIGDPALDDEFAERLRAGVRALVAAWSD
ncbi:MAG: TetR/AcrR family transcriptional regulator [Ilumatobacteraceae bacterium]|nr:TetR/AcrR family transcriptional regulator [Ilumatobacteraceae bacterium]